MRHFGAVKKAVIFAGGTGGRMFSVTKGKISKVNIEFSGKPLLGHTLRALQELRITTVALVIRPDQQDEFEQLIASGKFPRLKYQFLYTHFVGTGMRTVSKLHRMLNLPELREFVGNDPSVLLFGDAFFFPRFLKVALTNFMYRKRPLFLAMPERSTNPVAEQFYERVIESRDFVLGKNPPGFAGFITTPKFFVFLQQHLGADRGFGGIIGYAQANGHPCALMHGQAINMNNPVDYIAIREICAGRLRFPFPPGWVNSHWKELYAYEGLREARNSHGYKRRANKSPRLRKKSK